MPDTCCLAAASGLLGAFFGVAVSKETQDRVLQKTRAGAPASVNAVLGEDQATRKLLPSKVSSTKGVHATTDDTFDLNQVTLDMSRQISNGSYESERPDAELQHLRSRKIFGLGGFCTYNRIMLCMVGLPARGKSYIVNMLERYLRWTGFPVETFNAGKLRRQEGLAGADADFFSNEGTASSRREQLASRTMEAAIQWLVHQDDVSVAIFDATNTTEKRRRLIHERCAQYPGITPVFVESICDDPTVLEQNYKMKLGNDDYKDMDPEQARADFMRRVEMYEKRYETIRDAEHGGSIRYIKLFNVGQKVALRRCDGYAASNIGFYLSNIHITPRRIWLVHHAQTPDCKKGILGSVDGKLTREGRHFGRAVAAHVHRARRQMDGQQVVIVMGTNPVHQATCDAMTTEGSNAGDPEVKAAAAAARTYPVMSTSLLNELDGGDCNGMSYDEMQTKFPEMWAAREGDKLNFRYPGAGGESYIDVINRLRPVIIEVERQKCSVLVISHLAVHRCIYAYFADCPIEALPHIDMDMNTVIELHPGPFGTRVEGIPLGQQPYTKRQSRYKGIRNDDREL